MIYLLTRTAYQSAYARISRELGTNKANALATATDNRADDVFAVDVARLDYLGGSRCVESVAVEPHECEASSPASVEPASRPLAPGAVRILSRTAERADAALTALDRIEPTNDGASRACVAVAEQFAALADTLRRLATQGAAVELASAGA